MHLFQVSGKAPAHACEGRAGARDRTVRLDGLRQRPASAVEVLQQEVLEQERSRQGQGPAGFLITGG